MLASPVTLRAPDTAPLALWVDAWLRAQVATDDLLTAVSSLVPDCPPISYDGGATLAELLARLRNVGAAAAWPLLPRPGRTLGWPRMAPWEPVPSVLLVTARDTGAALLAASAHGWCLAALPETEGPDPVAGWLLSESLSTRQATRRFVDLLADATAELGALGLDRTPAATFRPRWEPATAKRPPRSDPELTGLLIRVAGVLDALELALSDTGAAVTAAEAAARSRPLRQLHGELTDLVVSVAVGATRRPSLDR